MKYNKKAVENITLIFSIIIFITIVILIKGVVIFQTKSEKTVENRIVNYE